MGDVTIETPIEYWWQREELHSADWMDLDPTAPPQLYTDTVLALRIRFHNYGTTTKYVLPWMNVTPPSGQVFGKGPAGEVKTEVAAGEDASYIFESVLLDEVGVWQAMFFVAEADTPEAIPSDMQTDLMPVAVASAPPLDIKPVVSVILGVVMIGMVMSLLPKMLGGE